MIGSKEAKDKTLAWLRKTESVEVLDEPEKGRLSFRLELDVWEVVTEISNEQDNVVDIVLHLVFLEDYPLTFPKVFLSPQDYEKYKYIPHVNADRIVCNFSSNASPNADYFERVTEQSIRKAKRIIEEGIKKINYSDFEDEFVAYWRDSYGSDDLAIDSAIILVEDKIETTFKIFCLDESLNEIRYVVHQDGEISDEFKDYLDRKKISYSEVEGFYIGRIDQITTPPHRLSNKEVFKLIRGIDNTTFGRYKSFLNNKNYPKLALFSKVVNGEERYFGWLHKKAKLNRNGFRPGSITGFKALSTFQSNESVIRISPELFTNGRLVKRSAGTTSDTVISRVYLVAGIGSVGSNLIHFLNSENHHSFKLVDPDTLKIENIGRHLLGFQYINKKKTIGMKEYLLNKMPIQRVMTREVSIYHLANFESTFVNQSDYIFVAIGEGNIERWLASAVSNGLITKPVFFIWVEPYLCGGHCIYIHPNDNRYDDFFDKSHFFKFNAIRSDDYENPVLSAKEAGCQTGYTPYSSSNTTLFLGALYPKILEVMSNDITETKSYSWIGDKSMAHRLGISLSDYCLARSSLSLDENKL